MQHPREIHQLRQAENLPVPKQGTEIGFGLIEAGVFAVEAPLFAWFLNLSIPRALLVSLAVNGVTASASFLL